MKIKKAQTWSADAIIGVVLFVVSVIMLYYMAGPGSGGNQAQRLVEESEGLPSIIASEQSTSFLKGSEVSNEKVQEVANLSYEILKEFLGIESDFCIYFEDEKGNIVPVSNKLGIGSSLVEINGKSCSDAIS